MLPIRFMDNVIPEPNSGCWLWTANLFSSGYARFNIKDTESSTGWRSVRAHRLSYRCLIGPIPDDLVLDHKCRVRSCVNPAHLEAVTVGENIRRGLTGNINRVKIACPKGHIYSGVDGRGRRQCKVCHAEREKQRYRSNPEIGRAYQRRAYWADPERFREYARKYRAQHRKEK